MVFFESQVFFNVFILFTPRLNMHLERVIHLLHCKDLILLYVVHVDGVLGLDSAGYTHLVIVESSSR